MPDAVQTGVHSAGAPAKAAVSLRLAILMNVIAPYHKPLLDRLAQRYGDMRILLSTPMESNRPWKLEWEGLDVVIQKNVTLRRRWRHPKGFSEPLYVHVPIDTVVQLSRFRPDVVISWEMGMRTILAAVYRRLHRRSKLMVWAEFAESTEYGRGALRQTIRKILHRGIDGFLVTGASGARYLQSLGIPARKIHRIVYTTDVELFAACSLDRAAESAWQLLYVGQLIERKGLVRFLEELSSWTALHPDRRIGLTFAGDGPLRAYLEQYAVPPNLQLFFLGNVAYADLPGVYAKAGIFVLPSLADTWGVVVNEAMAAGLPVLGSVYGQAVAELVESDVNGWTFRPDRGTEMFEAIKRAMDTSIEELDHMRENARMVALRLTPDHVTDLIDHGIQACVADQNRPASVV